jgi:acetyl-CoA synthetase
MSAPRRTVLRNVLTRLGIAKGDVVATLAGRIPSLYVAALGTLKNGSVYTPLFSAFGPDPIVSRMTIARARVLVTTDTLYRRKVEPVRARMPALEHVLLVRETEMPLPPGTCDCNELLDAASDEFTIPPTDPQDLALLHFTSGTTGTPKGAMHVQEAVVAHHETARLALDFHAGDRFWCTADPGWVTGTSYGIIAPLTHGLTTIVDEGDFDADNGHRPHRALSLAPPVAKAPTVAAASASGDARIVRRDRLGGVVHEYMLAA